MNLYTAVSDKMNANIVIVQMVDLEMILQRTKKRLNQYDSFETSPFVDVNLNNLVI